MHKSPVSCPERCESEEEPHWKQQDGREEWLRHRPIAKDLVSIEKLNQFKRRKRLVKTLAVFVLSLEIIANHLNDYHFYNTNQDLSSPIHGQPSLTRGVLQVIVLVAASNGVYAEGSADSPAVDALLDEDEDDDELEASPSNDYPDGDNDNDESYEDGDGT